MLVRAWFVSALVVVGALRSVCAQDTVRVSADNPPVWGANVSLAKIFSIGDVDGPPEYAFGAIEYFATLPDGRFFIYDRKDVQVRAYDARGKFIAKVGKKGDGPGEYRQLMGMDILGDSLLATWDVENRRVSYFRADGKYVRSFTPPNTGQVFAAKVFGIDAGGLHYLRKMLARAAAPGAEPRFVYVRFDSNGNVVDTVRIPLEDSGKSTFVLFTTDGARLSFPIRTVTSMYPLGGLLSARTDRYAISVPARASGKPMIIEHRYTPVPVRSEERTEWDAIAQDFANARSTPNSTPSPRFEPQPLPRFKPAFRELLGDADGRIWVEVYTGAEKRNVPPRTGGGQFKAQLTWRERTVYDVFSRTGQFLGHVALPPQSILLAARGSTMWVQSVGDSDEETVIAYRFTSKSP